MNQSKVITKRPTVGDGYFSSSLPSPPPPQPLVAVGLKKIENYWMKTLKTIALFGLNTEKTY